MVRQAGWRIIAIVMGVALSAGAAQLSAQVETREEREGGLPRDVARDVAAVWNAPATRRERGPFTLASNDTVRGDLAVLGGPATIRGVVLGQVVVINGDVELASSARINGNLTVVGGTLDRSQGAVVGDIRAWRARMRLREVDGNIHPEPENELAARWQRWRRFSDDEGRRSELFLSTAHTYNRVEGLPIYFGPRLRARNGDTRYDVELFGIFRTGEGLSWIRENLGHRVRVEVRQGRNSGFAIGGRLFDEVAPVERWQLSGGEVGLASFLFSRDYRDYWNRHGGAASLRLFTQHRNAVTASYGEERWSSRSARDPWTLFNGNTPWRLNPAVDEGVVRLFTVEGVFDTRNDLDHPRTGWLLSGEYERGAGDLTRSTLDLTVAAQDARAVTYGRAFLDLRRYNRLGPNAQLNLRAVVGGWVHGDPLPIQRRLSVSGVDALPGYDFRRLLTNDFDVGTCVSTTNEAYAAIGRPANCQRMLLLQAEWKGDFRVNLGGDDDYGDSRWYTSRFNADGTWVVFANSGRGWIPGKARDIATGETDESNGFPPIHTWRTDIGGGFDFGSFGLYVAKAVTNGSEKPNFYLRLGRRF
jgi:hypothetical protein